MNFLKTVYSFLSTNISIGDFDLPFSWVTLLGAVLLAGLLYVAYRLILFGLKKILVKIRIKKKTSTRIHRWTKLALRIIYALLILLLIGWLFGARMFEYLGKFFGILGEPILSTGSTSISFWTIILTLPVFYFASWAGRTSRNFINRSFLKRTSLDEAKRFSISSLARYGVMVVVVLVGLSVIGIDLSALAVIFGVLGIGIGFGLQGVVSNFFSGVIIILTRPVKEGDRILVENYDATVMHIRMLSTVINTITEETIIIPNSSLVNNMVHNYSYDSRQIIVKNEVSVSYGSDLDKVLLTLTEVASGNPYLAEGLKPSARVVSFDDSGISMSLFTRIIDVNHKFLAISWNNLEIWRRFKQVGITIPFPQVDLHLIDQNQDIRIQQRRAEQVKPDESL